MSAVNFYTASTPEYFWHQGKPHYNWGNDIVHSSMYKKLLEPIRQKYDYQPGEYTQMAFYFGHVPQLSWIYGNLDYSFNKYHRHYQAHDDWYPDRKGKTLGHKNGSMAQPNMKQSKFMTLQPNFIPKGCYREIRKYQACASTKGQENKEACFNDKLSIMEVCPDHVLEGLREKRKWYLRAETIDNQTYKRAMQVSDYNKGRSVADLDIKNWAYGHPKNLRSGTTWEDDRYNPRKYPHPHRYDNVNFPDQEYKDVFGGTMGTAKAAELDKFNISLTSGKSTGMMQHQALKAAAAEVDKLNEKKEE